MTRTIGYAAGGEDVPVYARALRLRHLRLSGGQCFLLFEAMIVIGALLALAELVPWWGVFALPLAVAAMVKINDLIAGTAVWTGRRSGGARRARARRPAGVARHDRKDATASAGHAKDRPDWVPVHGRQHGRQHGQRLASPPGRVIGRAIVPAALRATPPDESTTLGLASASNVPAMPEPVDSPRQRARQTATRRYG
jgi:hypothetical protein